jgi:hypothetical protein
MGPQYLLYGFLDKPRIRHALKLRDDSSQSLLRRCSDRSSVFPRLFPKIRNRSVLKFGSTNFRWFCVSRGIDRTNQGFSRSLLDD